MNVLVPKSCSVSLDLMLKGVIKSCTVCSSSCWEQQTNHLRSLTVRALFRLPPRVLCVVHNQHLLSAWGR